MDEDNEDLSVIEFFTPESFAGIDIEEDIGTMGDDFSCSGIQAEETIRRRIALIVISSSCDETIRKMIKDATYEEPISFPQQNCYNLSLCACIEFDSNSLIISPEAKILKKQWQELVDEIVNIVSD